MAWQESCLWFLVCGGILILSASLEEPCTRMERNCRLQTHKIIQDGFPYVNLNISCFCEEDEPEDVWGYLDILSTRKCSWLPTDDNGKVNLSTIHITGCLIQQEVFPPSILQLARRTEQLEIIFNKCPYVRLGSLTQSQKLVSRLNVSFTDSKLSGLPRGWISDAQKLHVKIENCEIPVVESKALSGFDADAEVNIQISNTSIYTIKMDAFQLPSSGSFSLTGGKVTSWDRFGYSGGSDVKLEEVKVARLMGKALDLTGVLSFRMSAGTVAEMLAEAIIDQDAGSVPRGPQGMRERTATIEHNSFVKANGDSFINLCKFTSIVFQNNTFLDIIEPPLRLQSDSCETKRSWDASFYLVGMNCTKCEHFTSITAQSCALYHNAYCVSCETTIDNCNAPLLQYLIQQKCPTSHPAISSALTDACEFDPSAPQREPRYGNGGCLIMDTENPFIIMMALTLMLFRHSL